jgi:hypothetical protein
VAPTRTDLPPAAQWAEARHPQPVGSPNPPRAAYVPLAGFLVLLALSAVLTEAGDEVPRGASLAMFAVAVAGCSALATFGTTALLTACAWLDYDGFVTGSQGSLSWHGRADVIRIGVLAGTALAVWALRAARRRRSGLRRDSR